MELRVSNPKSQETYRQAFGMVGPVGSFQNSVPASANTPGADTKEDKSLMPAKTISFSRPGFRLLILGAALLCTVPAVLTFSTPALAGLRPLPAQSGRCSGTWTINGEQITRAK